MGSKAIASISARRASRAHSIHYALYHSECSRAGRQASRRAGLWFGLLVHKHKQLSRYLSPSGVLNFIHSAADKLVNMCARVCVAQRARLSARSVNSCICPTSRTTIGPLESKVLQRYGLVGMPCTVLVLVLYCTVMHGAIAMYSRVE